MEIGSELETESAGLEYGKETKKLLWGFLGSVWGLKCGRMNGRNQKDCIFRWWQKSVY